MFGIWKGLAGLSACWCLLMLIHCLPQTGKEIDFTVTAFPFSCFFLFFLFFLMKGVITWFFVSVHKDIQVNNFDDNSTTWFTISAYMNECTHGVLIGSFRCKMKQNIQPCSTCRPALSFGWAWPKKAVVNEWSWEGWRVRLKGEASSFKRDAGNWMQESLHFYCSCAHLLKSIRGNSFEVLLLTA